MLLSAWARMINTSRPWMPMVAGQHLGKRALPYPHLIVPAVPGESLTDVFPSGKIVA